MKQTKVDLKTLGDRVDHIENRMGDYAQARGNELIDAHDNLTEEIRNNKIKMVDLEAQFRHNNVKFRGIAESVPATELRPFIQKMIAELLPSVKHHE